MKETLIFMGPIFARAGYGDHSKDLLRSIYKLDKYDIKIVPTRWGNTPQNQLDEKDEFDRWCLANVITQSNQKPDIFVQVSVANEFQAIGQYNIGITAGVETTIAPAEFVEGCNRMNHIIVPSEFTKTVLQNTSFDVKDNNTGQIVRQIKLTTPVSVLHEGVSDIFYTNVKPLKDIDSIPEDFNFLIVGHWLRGITGEDRKDIGMTIKTLASVFQFIPKEKRPGIILKTSLAGFSYLERSILENKIKSLLAEYKNAPNVYLVYGDLSQTEMAGLYSHPKVKALVSFTKGEGYGRPLCEFGFTGKPVIASKWSGQLDFLSDDDSVLIEGEIKPIHDSVVDQFLIKESSWFTVNYSIAGKYVYDVWKNYDKHLDKSSRLKTKLMNRFTLQAMDTKLGEIFQSNITGIKKMMPITLPKLKKIDSGTELPKLNIVK